MVWRPQFQFSVATLLLAITVAAIILGTVAFLEIPFSNMAVQGLLAFYLFMVGMWALIFGPQAFANWSRLAKRRRQLRASRAVIQRELREFHNSRSRREDPPRPSQ